MRMGRLLMLPLILGGPAAAAEPRGQPLPPHAELFLGCFETASREHTVTRDGRYLLFTCHGASAQAFYEALGARPRDVAYEEVGPDGAVARFTERPKKDTSGIDVCRYDGRADYACTLIFPAGGFLDR